MSSYDDIDSPDYRDTNVGEGMIPDRKPKSQSDKPGTGLEPRFTEQGIQVYEMNDMEWWAARSKEEAIAAALKTWGGNAADYWDGDPVEELYEMDLDANKVNINEDCDPDVGPIIPYRENIKLELAKGTTFPCFFCGDDR